MGSAFCFPLFLHRNLHRAARALAVSDAGLASMRVVSPRSTFAAADERIRDEIPSQLGVR
jgi:hypothetical protein